MFEKRQKAIPLILNEVKNKKDRGDFSLVAINMAGERLANNLKLDTSIYEGTCFHGLHITCCRGLLCFSTSFSLLSEDGDKIFVWNPCTREFLKVTFSLNYKKIGNFDIRISDYDMIGFGYISYPINQYKVVGWHVEEVIGHGCGGSWHHDVNIGDEGSDGTVVYIIFRDGVHVCSQFCHGRGGGGVLLMHPHMCTFKDAGDDQW